HRKNFDVPVIILVNGLPVAEVLGRMDAAGCSVKDEMKVFRHRSNALQSSAQKRSQIHAQSRTIQPRPLESGFVMARQNPGLVWNAWRIGTHRQIVPASFDDAMRL